MEDVNKRQQIFLSLFLNSSAVPKKPIPRESPTFEYFQRIAMNPRKFEETRIHFKSEVFADAP